MFDKANTAKGVVLLAHGAGAGMDHPFMTEMDTLLTEQGFEVRRFEFPYMQKRREDGKKRPPDRLPKLIDYFCEQIAALEAETSLPIYLAGKSMGGRVATMVLEQTSARAAFVFGYPFHPPGKPDNLRTEHLLTMSKPVKVFQGERDTMGNSDEVPGYGLSSDVDVIWMEDGNHDLKPRVASGFTQQDHMLRAAKTIGEYVR